MSDYFAVIGNPVSHSLSPIIHQLFAQQFNISLLYDRLLGDVQHFERQVLDFFSQGGSGLNCTLPFKERAYTLAREHTDRCGRAKAANTLWMKEGRLHADNTDGIGFIRDVSRYIDLKDKRILLLGAGGAARGILQPILDMHPKQLMMFNRTEDKVFVLQKEFPKLGCFDLKTESVVFDLVINATSPSGSGFALALLNACLSKNTFGYDLSYSLKEKTPFIRYLEGKGCDTVDGVGMLVEQAAESFYIWYGLMPKVAPVLASLKKSFNPV